MSQVHPGWDADEQSDPNSISLEHKEWLPVGRVVPRRMEPVRGEINVDQTIPPTKWGQPDPIPNNETDIQSMVIADIQSRRDHGIKTYGTALQPFNGRNALQDMYEEDLDRLMYLKQRLIEDESLVSHVKELRLRLRDAQAKVRLLEQVMNDPRSTFKLLWDDVGAWSNEVFGDEIERGPVGPLNHLAREAKETIAEVEKGDREKTLVELADCLILVCDSTRRAGFSAIELLTAALEKMIINRGRVMGEPDEEGVIEHVRT